MNVFAWINAFTGFTAVRVQNIAVFTILFAVFRLTLMHCKKKTQSIVHVDVDYPGSFFFFCIFNFTCCSIGDFLPHFPLTQTSFLPQCTSKQGSLQMHVSHPYSSTWYPYSQGYSHFRGWHWCTVKTVNNVLNFRCSLNTSWRIAMVCSLLASYRIAPWCKFDSCCNERPCMDRRIHRFHSRKSHVRSRIHTSYHSIVVDIGKLKLLNVGICDSWNNVWRSIINFRSDH